MRDEERRERAREHSLAWWYRHRHAQNAKRRAKWKVAREKENAKRRGKYAAEKKKIGKQRLIASLHRQIVDAEAEREKWRARRRRRGRANAEACKRWRARKKEQPRKPGAREAACRDAGLTIGRKHESMFVVVGPDGYRHREFLASERLDTNAILCPDSPGHKT